MEFQTDPVQHSFPHHCSFGAMLVGVAAQPTPISDPDRMPIEDHLEGKHLDMSAGGLYTQSEITSWEHHIEFGSTISPSYTRSQMASGTVPAPASLGIHSVIY